MPYVEVATDQGVTVVTLARIGRLNALSVAMLDEVLEVLDRAESDRTPIVITGTGRAFCAGADLMEVQDPQPGETLGGMVGRLLRTHFNEVPRRLLRSSVPVVTAINGVTAGGGIGLALAADVALAGTSSVFINVFAQQLGLVPDMGSSWLVPRAIGRSRAQAWALTGRRIDASTAANWGLVYEVVPDGELLNRSVAIAVTLGRLPEATLAAVRRTAEDSSGSFEEALEREWVVQEELIDRGYFAEGIQAFISGQQPQFRD